MMIHFWENTFWAKTSLFIVFSVPNSVYPEVFRCDDHSGNCFKAVWWTASEKNTFWAKASLFFVFSGPNSVHSEGFRSDDHNGTSFKAVWWSISEKTHFGLKHHFSLYLVYQIQFTLRFSGLMITVVQISKLYDELLLKKAHFEPNHHFSLNLVGKLSALWGFQVWWSWWHKFQSCMMICFWKKKTHLG